MLGLSSECIGQQKKGERISLVTPPFFTKENRGPLPLMAPLRPRFKSTGLKIHQRLKPSSHLYFLLSLNTIHFTDKSNNSKVSAGLSLFNLVCTLASLHHFSLSFRSALKVKWFSSSLICRLAFLSRVDTLLFLLLPPKNAAGEKHLVKMRQSLSKGISLHCSIEAKTESS